MRKSSTRLKLLTFLFGLIVTLSWIACEKDDQGGTDNNSGPDCNIQNADLRFDTNIKPIIDRNCNNCHAGQGPGPGNYTTYSGMIDDLRNGSILETVVIDKTMPQGGSMTQAERDSINCWIKAGFPE